MEAKILLFLLLAASFSTPLFGEEATIPKGFAPERYERLWKKSPFTVASVLVAAPTDTTTFADSLTLVGLMTIGNKPLVTVVSTDSQETQLVEMDKPNATGLQVVSFVNNLDPSKVEVVLKKGDVSGTLHFVINETPAAPQDLPNVNGQQPQQPQVLNRPNVPRQVLPRNNLPRTAGPVIGQPTIVRRRAITLPGANRPNEIRPNPQRQNPPRSNVIPPP